MSDYDPVDVGQKDGKVRFVRRDDVEKFNLKKWEVK